MGAGQIALCAVLMLATGAIGAIKIGRAHV